MGPITGPFTKRSSAWHFVQDRTWFRQWRPYNLVLPFDFREGGGFGPDGYENPPVQVAARYRLLTENLGPAGLYERAYDDLVGKLGETAGLGIDLAQYRQADRMIKARATQLREFGSALVRRSPYGAAAALGVSLSDARRIFGTRHGASKTLANLWLEFWFGWKPAVMDIYSAAQVFVQDIPSAPIIGKAKLPIHYLQKPSSQYAEGIEVHGFGSCKVGCHVRLVNPNLHLANALGLLNPVQVLYDGIPWSFVLGWFSNMDQYLRSITDFAGWEVSKGFRTYFTKTSGKTWWPAYPQKGSAGYGVVCTREALSSIPRPEFSLSLGRIRPTRGLTAMSLLVQQLPQDEAARPHRVSARRSRIIQRSV